MPLKLLLFGRIKGWGILSQSSTVSTSRHRVAMRITGDPVAVISYADYRELQLMQKSYPCFLRNPQ